MTAFDEWRHGQDGEHAVPDQIDQHGGRVAYESQLLYCAGQLSRLDRLSSQLRQPHPVTTAIVCDLFHHAASTLPTMMRQLLGSLAEHVETAIYSEEKMSSADAQQFSEVVGRKIDRVPYFLVAQRQRGALEQYENQMAEMKRVVEEHLKRRKHVLEFVVRTQEEERIVLQKWLFTFWAITFGIRKNRMERMANVMLSSSCEDILTPFMTWHLYVCKNRLQAARTESEDVDREAREIANRITAVEIENEQQQKKLEESLKQNSEMKQQCESEKEEHERLQRLWDATQPELLLDVLAQSLEFFFGLIVRAAKFSKIEVRQRLAAKNITSLLCDLPPVHDVDPDELVMRWVNGALARGREAVSALLAEGVAQATQRARCEVVRKQEDIVDFGDDLCDGCVLVTLAAVLRAEIDGRELSISDLWPLDERDPELRASHVCTVLPMFAPTAQARCLLTSADIVQGNEMPLTQFLAAVMLHQPLLPILGLEDPTQFTLPALPSLISDGGSSANSFGGLTPTPHPAFGVPSFGGQLSAEPSEHTAESPEPDITTMGGQLEAVLRKIEEMAGSAAYELLEDPTPLLHGGEDFHALATISTEQLLLRWTNVQLKDVYHRLVENFGSDLQDGMAIGLLLDVVAPEVTLGEPISHDLEERLEVIAMNASRCTDFELLTPTTILDSQSDVLAAFLAQLFLARPNLAARPDSLLKMHLGLLEETCRTGYAALASRSDRSKLMELCSQLEQRWGELLLAAQTVHESSRTMRGMQSRMRAFLGDTLAHRAQGRPQTMLDAKEARDFLFYTSLNPERLSSLLSKESTDSTIMARIETLLKKHFRLFRDIFRHYTSTPSGAGAGITLEGLVKLYQDCKLRSRDLAPHHVETIFYDQMDNTGSVEKTLTPQSFIEVLLYFASMKFKTSFDSVPQQLTALVEQHLQPYSCHESESLFQRMSYDPKVRETLRLHTEELKIVFDIYGALDQSTTAAMQNTNTMNISEFQLLLAHCNLIDETLTKDAVFHIFQEIQLSATDGLGSDEHDIAGPGEGVGDDEELAFSEFLDGLVAIAAYKHPDPFVPFCERVDVFVLELFAALRRHWSRKRVSSQVNAMLNALQKKLRN